MGRMIHLLLTPDPDQQFLILEVSRKHFGEGGAQRIKYTLPPILMQAFQLAGKFHEAKAKDGEWDAKVGRIFKFCLSTISDLAKAEMTDLPLRLYLQGALALDKIPCENQVTKTISFYRKL